MADAAIKTLRRQLSRRASRAVVVGFRPPIDPLTSWFGKVNLATAGEDYPCWNDAAPTGLPPEIDESYHDFFDNQGGTKVSGWPSLI